MLLFIYIQLIVCGAAQDYVPCEANSVLFNHGGIAEGKLPFMGLNICNPGLKNGSSVSQKFERSDKYVLGGIYERRWTGCGCLGQPYYEKQIAHDPSETSLAGPDSLDREYTQTSIYYSSDCDYVIVRVYEDCGDDYWDQSWRINDCFQFNQYQQSCHLNYICGTDTYANSSWSQLTCYWGNDCVVANKSGTIGHQMDQCSMNDIKNKSYKYEVLCDANIALCDTTLPPNVISTTVISTTIISTTVISQVTTTSTDQTDKWMIITIVFIVLFVIVIIGVVFILLVKKRNVKKDGYTKTSVADTDQA
eukprot:369830_1